MSHEEEHLETEGCDQKFFFNEKKNNSKQKILSKGELITFGLSIFEKYIYITG